MPLIIMKYLNRKTYFGIHAAGLDSTTRRSTVEMITKQMYLTFVLTSDSHSVKLSTLTNERIACEVREGPIRFGTLMPRFLPQWWRFGSLSATASYTSDVTHMDRMS